MRARTYMTEYRERNGLTLLDMAKQCRTFVGRPSVGLLRLLESDDQYVTHPNIAERVSEAYKLTPEQAEGLVPEHYRKSSPNYNPDLYRNLYRD